MKTPTIQNIADIKTSTEEPRLIHFTIEQWKNAVKDITVENFDEKRHGKLTGITGYQNPDEVIIYPGCEPGKDEICRMDQKYNPITGSLDFECNCKQPPGTHPPGTIHPKNECNVVYNGQSKRFECIGNCPGGCHFRLVRTVWGSQIFFKLVCRCGN